MHEKPAEDVTTLLSEAGQGDPRAMTRLAEVVYDELRGLAHAILDRQMSHQTLRTTALVNEAWLRMVGDRNVAYENRTHFFRTAARAMRTILIDYARTRSAQKRGGAWKRSPLDDVVDTVEVDQVDLIALDDALTKLEALSPRRSEVVELRFFGGLSIAETARVLDVSHGTVENDWNFARAWLHREIAGGQP
jgi:RNA polymerase sigma-70 factor, ECF subfamily